MKSAVLIALIAMASNAVAAETVSVKMLKSGVTISVSDDGRYTYIDLKDAMSADSMPIVFERNAMDGKHLRNYVINTDGRLQFDGVIRRADVLLDGERVEISRS